MSKPFDQLVAHFSPERRARVERRVAEESEKVRHILAGKSDGVTPGAAAPRSGVYTLVGPRGGRTDIELVMAAGDRLPRTRRAGQRWVLVGRASRRRSAPAQQR